MSGEINSIKPNNFFDFAQLQPLNYLVFAEKSVRGLSSNKSQILIKNISDKPIIYRVVQNKADLVLKVRPFIQLVLPKEQKELSIFNDSDLVPTLDNRLIIEIVTYKQNIEEWSPKLFQENANLFSKDKQSYEYKLYQTNLLNIVCYEYTLKEIENRICNIQDVLHKWITFEIQNTKSMQLTITLIMITGLVLIMAGNYLPIQIRSLHHLFKHLGV